MVSRRMVLISGGAAALVAGAGLAAYAHGPGTAPALAPWKAAGKGFDDPRLTALSYAILAPNSHNRQPWEFELAGDDTIDVYCDLDRRLPQTDPYDRQIVVSFGCMLELLSIAASAQGYRAEIASFPDGYPQGRLDARRIATVTLVPEATETDPLFAQITQRRSNKQPYALDRPVPADTIDALVAGLDGPIRGGWTDAPDRVRAFKEMTKAAFKTEYRLDRTRRESIDAMRIGNRAVAQTPDGIEMPGLFMGLMRMAGIVTPKALDTPGTIAFNSGLDIYDDIIEATPAFIWLTSTDASRALQIEAGRAWVRLNLMANAAGLSVHPLSQILQEFPEMAEGYSDMHAALGVSQPGVVQMFARIGYAPVTAPTPRWPLAAKLVPQGA